MAKVERSIFHDYFLSIQSNPVQSATLVNQQQTQTSMPAELAIQHCKKMKRPTKACSANHTVRVNWFRPLRRRPHHHALAPSHSCILQPAIRSSSPLRPADWIGLVVWSGCVLWMKLHQLNYQTNIDSWNFVYMLTCIWCDVCCLNFVPPAATPPVKSLYYPCFCPSPANNCWTTTRAASLRSYYYCWLHSRLPSHASWTPSTRGLPWMTWLEEPIIMHIATKSDSTGQTTEQRRRQSFSFSCNTINPRNLFHFCPNNNNCAPYLCCHSVSIRILPPATIDRVLSEKGSLPWTVNGWMMRQWMTTGTDICGDKRVGRFCSDPLIKHWSLCWFWVTGTEWAKICSPVYCGSFESIIVLVQRIPWNST